MQKTEETETEKIFMLCRKFAEKSGGTVAISHDRDSVSTAVAAVCSGAIALAGKRCIYFKSQPLFATRQAVKTYFATGGIHVFTDEEDQLCMMFVDKNGNNSDFCGGKAVFSNKFFAVGIVPINGYKYHFTRKILTECNNLPHKSKVLVSTKSPAVRDVLKSVFSETDCELSFFGGVAQNGKLTDFAKTVRSGNYEAGVHIDSGGETAVFIDKNGEILNKKTYPDFL